MLRPPKASVHTPSQAAGGGGPKRWGQHSFLPAGSLLLRTNPFAIFSASNPGWGQGFPQNQSSNTTKCKVAEGGGK